MESQSLPVINITASSAAGAIREACRDRGFFYVVGHGIDEALSRRLEGLSREFFAKPSSEKLAIRMELGGRAWRGYFPGGDELTSGSPDQKEGIYFGAELPASHPKVVAGTPLHGANLFPEGVPGFRKTVLGYIDRMTGGRYRSTPHRVQNVSGRDRLSFPFFFDPNWDADVHPIEPAKNAVEDEDARWDRISVHDFRGTYGDYLINKVSKVFPELRHAVH